MNILMLTPYLPYPLVSGGQIRTYNLLKNLCKHHNITLFAFIRKEEERQYIKELEPFCQKIQVFKRTPVWSPRNILLSQFSFDPLLVTMYRSGELQQAVRTELTHGQYDLIHAETFYMMPNIPRTKLPEILVVQTIEHLGYLDYTRKQKNLLVKPFLYWDVMKIQHWETLYWKRATRLITMSEADRDYIRKHVPDIGNIDVVANGVDIPFFNAVKKQLTKDFVVLFVGTFKWLPNVEAVEYLVSQVWGKIKAKIPNAKLWIVGNSPTAHIESLANDDPSIIVKGKVEDIRDAYKSANVLLAPVWSGKGTRYKILEAMATETPVVATKLAVEGLGVEPGIHALVTDSSDQLAKDTVALSSAVTNNRPRNWPPTARNSWKTTTTGGPSLPN
jgi:glycosyltransferase involved in cell wall biosynthesis